MPQVQQSEIINLVDRSPVRSIRWKDRGRAPGAYIRGMALSFAWMFRQLEANDQIAVEIAAPALGSTDRDALAHCADLFTAAGIPRPHTPQEQLTRVYTLLVGLGMRESSGKHCEGRDQSASNVQANTCETGLFQVSYNSHKASPALDQLIAGYSGPDLLEIFSQGVECSQLSWRNEGTPGPGVEFQAKTKANPGFAVAYSGLLLRNLRRHWGPINRKRAEIRRDVYQLFCDIAGLIEGRGFIAPQPWTAPRAAQPTGPLDGLNAGFATRLQLLIEAAAAESITLVPTSGLRDPWKQARLWRRSRSSSQVQEKIDDLKMAGAPYLSQILEEVGPQANGSWRTNAPPGLSWHQLGYAVDFGVRSPTTNAVLLGDRQQDGAELEYARASFRRMGRLGDGLDLTWGGDFRTPDENHVQGRPHASPASEWSLPEIDRRTRQLWPTRL